MTDTLRVKKWEEFQHYRKRTPPWIKLHRAVLEDYAIARLPDGAKAHLFGIWCLAAANGGEIPNDPVFVGQKINATEPVDLQLFVSLGFLLPSNPLEHNASNMLDHDACIRRGETEERQRRDRGEVGPFADAKPEPQHPPASIPYLVRCVMALNAGLAANPKLEGFREISSSEQAGTVTWEGEGIPVEVAEATVRRVAAGYKPKPNNRQPSGLRYFDAPVREAAFGKKRDTPRTPDRWVDPHQGRRRGALTTSLADVVPGLLGRITPTEGAA